MQNKGKEKQQCTIYLSKRGNSPIQDDNVQMLMQLDECLKVARKYEYRASKEFYDYDSNINPLRREEFSKMLEYIANNQISAVVIASANALSPDYAIYLKVEEILEASGVKLICSKLVI